LQYQRPSTKKTDYFDYEGSFGFTPFNKLEKCYQFYSAVAMFGSLLRSSPFLENSGWNEMISLAENSFGNADPLQKEFTTIVQQAKILYSKNKKKKPGSSEW